MASGALAGLAVLVQRAFANPRGLIENRGRYHSFTRKGPGRRAASRNHEQPSGHKLWRKAKEGKLGLRY